MLEVWNLTLFLLASTLFHFSSLICIVFWKKSSNMEILVSLSFLQFLRIFILSLWNEYLRLLLPFLYRSTFLQHDASFLWLYYLCPSLIFLLTTHRSCFHTLPRTLGECPTHLLLSFNSSVSVYENPSRKKLI